MMAGWRARSAVVACSALLGCDIGEIDFTQKSCPCPEAGWVCDTATNRCTQGLGCTPRFTADDFRAAWATTRNIRWEWEPLGELAAFGSYEIEISRAREDIESGTPFLRATRDTYPELGRFALPNTGNKDELVKGTVTYGLDADSPWFGRLVAIDSFGCPFHSPIVPVTMLIDSLQGEAVFFRDEEPVPGQLFAPEDQFAYRADCDGNPCLELVSLQGATSNIRVNANLPSAAFAGMSPGQFEQAFLEFRVWLEEPVISYWNSVWLLALPEMAVFRYEPYSPITTDTTPLQASYWTVQMPLRQLVYDIDGTPFTYQQLIQAGVGQFNFGTHVPVGKRVWLDDIRIRW